MTGATPSDVTPDLRPATGADAPEVADIWASGWRDGHLGLVPEALVASRTGASFRSRAAERVGDTTVATVDGAVAGFVMVVGAEVEQVYVSRRHRGTGVAAVLLAEAERQVAAAGHPAAWLAVAPGNVRARRFYERCGWADEGAFEYLAATDDGPVPVPCHRYVRRPAPGPAGRRRDAVGDDEDEDGDDKVGGDGTGGARDGDGDVGRNGDGAVGTGGGTGGGR